MKKKVHDVLSVYLVQAVRFCVQDKKKSVNDASSYQLTDNLITFCDSRYRNTRLLHTLDTSKGFVIKSFESVCKFRRVDA